MSGKHFFNEDQWHRTLADEDTKCICDVAVGGKVRGTDDDSWKFAPPEMVAPCMPVEVAFDNADDERKAGYVDAYVSAGDKALQLAAENAQLKAQIEQHEVLFATAIYTEDFLNGVFDGIAAQLPEGTPRTVEGIVTAVADMAMKLDCHEDASTPAFDEIAKLCGCQTWEYPGQVVRDVQHVVNERDALAKRRDELLATIARLSNELPFPDEVKNWTEQRAKLVAEVGTLKARVRELEENAVRMREYRFASEGIATDGKGTPIDPQAPRADGVATYIPGYDKYIEDRKADAAFIDDLTNIARDRQSRIVDLEREAQTLRDIAKDSHDEAVMRNGAMLHRTVELETQNAFLSSEQLRLIKERDEQKDAKDNAYRERDKCVAGLAALAVRLGWKAWIGTHPADEPWDDDWRFIIFINLPTGQVSWHIHDSELPMFDFLDERTENAWDGHTTEQKYERLLSLCNGAAPYERPYADRHQNHPDHNCDESCTHCPDCGSNMQRHIEQATRELRVETEALRNALQVVAGYVAGEEPIGTDAAKTLAGLARLVLGLDTSSADATKRCGCSDVYKRLNPGRHARYCPLVGLPMEHVDWSGHQPKEQ
jgi:hypothetical protein